MICLKAILIGFVLPLTAIDHSTLKRSKYVCKRDYQSCVKSVQKTGKLSYHVICFDKRSK